MANKLTFPFVIERGIIMLYHILEEIEKLDCVEGIAIGGSRASKKYDNNSDYDVYVYVTKEIDEITRQKILSKYCSYMEIGNRYWEYSDNCIMNDGIELDMMYRNLKEFEKGIENVVLHCQAANAYTTCMWHNLLHCNIVYDKTGKLEQMQKKFTVPYPQELKKAIIKRQMELMDTTLSAYKLQIEKAVKRNDLVSIHHRITEFLASYFDLLFAINEKTHIGEKRIMEFCKEECTILPKNFEQNINQLFCDMYGENQCKLIDDVNRIIENVKQIL